MSGRPTDDIARALSEVCGWSDRLAAHKVCRGAADRLAELEAENDALRQLRDVAASIVAVVKGVEALRPPCPTCGGKGTVWDTTTTIEDFARCPDCVDGKVTIEKLVALWQAATDPASDLHNVLVNMALDQYITFRTVKPT